MPHSRDLVASILSIVTDTYPAEGGFKSVIEKRLLGQARNVQPDIQVLDADGRVVCVVEIGYTRPEKLTYYRDVIGIRDVRWYDKSGVLHSSVTGHATVEYINRVIREVPDFSDAFCAIEFTNSNCFDYCWDAESFDPAEGWGHNGDTEGIVVANNKRRGAVVFCDECGQTYASTDDVAFYTAIVDGSEEPLDLYSFDSIRSHAATAETRWGPYSDRVAVSGVTFIEAQAIVRARMGFKLTYDQLRSFR